MRIVQSGQLALAASVILGSVLVDFQSVRAVPSTQVDSGSSDYTKSTKDTLSSDNSAYNSSSTISQHTDIIAQSGTVSNSSASGTKLSSTRDKWLWPFASTSIWNMPIGSGAFYTPANIQQASGVYGDEEHFYKLNASSPLRPVYAPGAWGEGRCKGTQSMGISLPIPDDLIVPDATSNPYYTPNNAAAFLMPDGKTLVQLEPLARCKVGGPIYGYRYSGPNGWTEVDIYGEGIGGTHWGSGLSAMGGSIRKGELISNEPIRHAVKVLMWAKKYLYYSQSVPGYRWPADRADGYAASNYGGTNPKLVMGTLLAIPPSVTEASLNLQTPAGRKLFHALEDYGAYVVDDTYGDSHNFAVEKGVYKEFRATYGYDFSASSGPFYDDCMKLFKRLYIVDNNGSNSIGGGGTPRVPLAPPIGN